MDRIFKFFKDGVSYENNKASGEKLGNITHYSESYIVTIGWLITCRGSIFSLIEVVVLGSIVAGLCTIIAYSSCDNNANKTWCMTLPDPSDSYLTLLTLCAFLVGFFNNSILHRWWSVRVHLQDAMEAANDVMMIVMSAISTAITNKRATRDVAFAYAKKLEGLLLLSFRLLINQVRRDVDFMDLVDQEFLTMDEYDYFTSLESDPLNSIVLIMNMIHEAGAYGFFGKFPGVADARLQYATERVAALRHHSSHLMMYIDVQIPFPFVQLVSGTVYAFIMQLIFVSSTYINYGIYTHQRAYMGTGYLTAVLYTYVLLGLLKLFDVLSNPLGYDGADFPVDSYYNHFKNDLDAVRLDTFALLDNDGVYGPLVRLPDGQVVIESIRPSKKAGSGSNSASRPSRDEEESRWGKSAKQNVTRKASSLSQDEEKKNDDRVEVKGDDDEEEEDEDDYEDVE